MDIKLLLGKRIQEIRKSKNITQEYLAELVGIDTVSLSNIERGKYYPSAENLNKILNALKIEPAELFAFQHLSNTQDLLDEMNEYLIKDPALAKRVYLFFKFARS
jgi:transcriptional regulator with XRE-family HTH domain